MGFLLTTLQIWQVKKTTQMFLQSIQLEDQSGPFYQLWQLTNAYSFFETSEISFKLKKLPLTNSCLCSCNAPKLQK